MTMNGNSPALKESFELVKNIRIAICGHLPEACRALRDIGVMHIDKYEDAVDLGFRLRNGDVYHLVLVYAPQGEGLNAEMPYKIHCGGEWKSVPIKLLNEPCCNSALIDLVSTVRHIARQESEYLYGNSG